MGVERAEVERRWLDWGGWVQASGSVSVGFGSFSYNFVAPQSEGRWVGGGWNLTQAHLQKPLLHLHPVHADSELDFPVGNPQPPIQSNRSPTTQGPTRPPDPPTHASALAGCAKRQH